MYGLRQWLSVVFAMAMLSGIGWRCPAAELGPPTMDKRWLFVWRPMDQPAEVDRVIARLTAAAKAGYNGLVLPHNVAPERAGALVAACREAGLSITAIVMGNPHDRNDFEGVSVVGAPFVVHGGKLVHQSQPVSLRNADFEQANGDQLGGWTMQDQPGTTTFVDRQIRHGGQASLRIQDVGQNEHRHARVAQEVQLVPNRQYRLSFWVKSEDLSPVDADAKVLDAETGREICFQTFSLDATQDWHEVNLIFNSFEHSRARLYLGSWWGGTGRLWFDDVKLEEIGLVNVLRRPGCPVVVRAADGSVLEEGRDVAAVVDPHLHPWRPWHEPPTVTVLDGGRLREGDSVSIDYYHSLVVYQDRLNGCLSEPRVFDDWRQEVKSAKQLLQPAAYLMSHDEIRVANRCALCRSRGLTPGQLLADNVSRAAAIIREEDPGREIWVWSDMFDPLHNAVDNYYAVNGSYEGSWLGLAPDVGIVNWHGGLQGKNCPFFADLGLRQVLSGYYDSDEVGSGIRAWLAQTSTVKGIVGAMYTTWEDKYGALAPWARAAWPSLVPEG